MTKCGLISLILLLNSCSQMPEIAKAVDDIATDNAITIKLDRDAIKQNTEVHVSVDVVPKPQ